MTALGPLSRSLPAGLLLLAVACSSPPQSGDAAGAPSPSFGSYENAAAALYDGWNRHSVYVPMADGTRIAVDYFLPTSGGEEATEPLPVILHYTRYIRASEGTNGAVRSRVDSDPVLRHMLRHGYAVAVADARGTGASFGVRRGAFSAAETADSHTLVAWLAAQPWSSGSVGMQGRSYPGMTQYQAATKAPAALKAIFAEMAGPTPYDFVFRGGTYKQDFIEVWGRNTMAMDRAESSLPARVDADHDGSLRAAAVAEHRANQWAHELVVEGSGAEYRDWTHTFPDGVSFSWDTASTIDDLEEIDGSGVAIYHLVGWYDIYTTQQPMLYASLEATPQKMIIGPWTHSGGYGGALHKAEILRWYDHWLKGIGNGVMDEPPVHYYVMQGNHTLPEGADRRTSLDEERAEDGKLWATAATWPPAHTSMRSLYLATGPSGSVDSRNDGTLLDRPGSEGRDDYVVDYTSRVGSFSRWMNGYGARRAEPEDTTFFDERSEEDRKALTYTSEPLPADLDVVGYPVVRLWVSISGSDADLFVYLEEVDAGGRSHYVSEGALRASNRALGKAEWNHLGLPYHRSWQQDRRPLPDEPVELVFDLMGTAIRVDAGHRLRLTVAGADAANHALYPDPEGKEPPTLSLHRGGSRASFVALPVAGAVDS